MKLLWLLATFCLVQAATDSDTSESNEVTTTQEPSEDTKSTIWVSCSKNEDCTQGSICDPNGSCTILSDDDYAEDFEDVEDKHHKLVRRQFWPPYPDYPDPCFMFGWCGPPQPPPFPLPPHPNPPHWPFPPFKTPKTEEPETTTTPTTTTTTTTTTITTTTTTTTTTTSTTTTTTTEAPQPTPNNSRSCLTENHCESGEECVRGKCGIENGEVSLNVYERAILYRLADKLCRDSDKCFKQFVDSLRGNKDINLCEELKQSGQNGEENSKKKEEQRQREFLKIITESKEKLVEAVKIVWRVSNEEYHKSAESKVAIDTILGFVGTKLDFFVGTSMQFINFVLETSAVSWEKTYEKGTYWFPTPDGKKSKPAEKIHKIVLDILNPNVASLNTDVIEKDVINYIKSFFTVTRELMQGPNPTETEMS